MESQKIADAVADIVLRDDRLLVPLIDIFAKLPQAAQSPDLFAIVQQDDRFSVYIPTDIDETGSVYAETNEQAAEILQSHGVAAGPKVLLKSKAPNASALLTQVAKELQAVQTALQQAYAHRQKNSPAQTEKIQAALTKAKQVEKELLEILEHIPNQN